MPLLTALGIIVSLVHSALFSGLNLGFFGVSRLRLEILAEAKDPDAIRILSLRQDAHLLLATILWGNVCSNVLLTLLTDSILTGVSAFLLSTFVITLFGEILPQAYFAKYALRASRVLVPLIEFYRFLLFPITKPTALLLDRWLGQEQVRFFRENELMIMLKKQALWGRSDLSLIESVGAVNFLKLDDIYVEEEGEVINPTSIISVSSADGSVKFPEFTNSPEDTFLQAIHASGEKWVIFMDPNQQPVWVMNADHFLRDIAYGKKNIDIRSYCHKPIVVTTPRTTMGQVIVNLQVKPEHAEDDVIDYDLILYWGEQKRIITGADILGRLLRGIAKKDA